MPARAEPRVGAATDVANELRPIFVRLARELRKETRHLGPGDPCCRNISEKPRIGLCELAELEGIATPTASGLVDRLERAQLVERVRSQTDRRRVGLTSTAAGRRLLPAVRALPDRVAG